MVTDHSILMVDDDVELSEMVKDFLNRNGFSIEAEASGIKAAERIISEQPGLVILDVMLPDMDGLTICRNVRSGFDGTSTPYQGPILMLTALGDDIDEVAGLEIGADDYLAKPVRARVLLARVRALLRRFKSSQNTLAKKVSEEAGTDLTLGDLLINHAQRKIEISGDSVALTTAEFDLFFLLAKNINKICSREQIAEHFSELGYDSSMRTIDLRVSRIRKKIGDSSKEPQRLKTIHGKGYMLVQMEP